MSFCVVIGYRTATYSAAYFISNSEMQITLSHDMKQLQEKQEALHESTSRIEELLTEMKQKPPGTISGIKVPRDLSVSSYTCIVLLDCNTTGISS